MKTITTFLMIFLVTMAVPGAQAQEETVWQQIERLEQQREDIIAEEKAALKAKVERINQRREAGELTREEAARLKDEAAQQHARNIQERVAVIENQISLLTKGNETDIRKIEEEERWLDWDDEHADKEHYSRTTTNLVIAAGFSNALQEGQSINESDFKIAGSRFFEIGLDWKVRVFPHSNWLRFRYGFSFQFNGLKPTDNRYFVEDEEITRLEEFPVELDKSKFRMDNLVVPVHFELGPYLRKEGSGKVWYSTENQFKIGLGGYAGLNFGERQKLKYSGDRGAVKEKHKNDFNVNDFVYGLSAYIGWGSTTLYAKYDLNPIFQDPNEQLNLIAAGLRVDLN